MAGGVDCASAGTWGDDDGHGTLVSGLIGAIDNDFGVVGNAPGARIWSVRVEDARGRILESHLLCGFEWVADHGQIEVANLSLGVKARVTGPCGVMSDGRGAGKVKDPLHAAICRAYAGGLVVVAAAGNDGYDVEQQLPAAYDEVIAVSAITETDGLVGGDGPEAWCLPGEFDDHLATFSNFGAGIELAAPGVCVPSTLPGNRWQSVSGTSFSSPYVAGAAALIRARGPILSPAQVRARLQEAAAQDPIPGDPDGITEPVLHVGAL